MYIRSTLPKNLKTAFLYWSDLRAEFVNLYPSAFFCDLPFQKWGFYTLHRVQIPTFRELWVDFGRNLTSIEVFNYVTVNLALFLTLLSLFSRVWDCVQSWTRWQNGELSWNCRTIIREQCPEDSSCSRKCSPDLRYGVDFLALACCEIGRKWLYLCNPMIR